MRGLDVKVRAPSEGKTVDALGNPVTTWGEESIVHDVLVVAGSTSDSLESNRPEGETVAYTLTFPRTFTASLRGCEVKVPGDGEWYRIAGDPKPQLDGQLLRPWRWNRTAEAVRSDG